MRTSSLSLPALLMTAVLVSACAAQPPASATPSSAPTVGATTSTPPPSATDAAGPTGTATPAASDPSTPTPTPTESPVPSGPSQSPPAGSPPADAFAWTELAIAAGPPAREDHTFTLAPDGTAAYLFGGRQGGRAFADLWRYDLAADAWQELTPAGDAPPARFGHVAAWAEGVGLVVWSGQDGPTEFFNDLWAYDPHANAWTRLPDGGDVPLARYGSCGAVGPDGRLWISHGFTADEGRFFDTRAYDFTSGSWSDETPAGDVPVLRCLHDCLWTPDGRFLLYAGQTTGAPAIGDMWRFQPEPGVWTQEPDPAAPARQLYALGELDGRAFVFGGGNRNGRPLGDLWQLDLATLVMSEIVPSGDAPSARFGAAFVGDPAAGRLLLFGGKGAAGELGDLWQLSVSP